MAQSKKTIQIKDWAHCPICGDEIKSSRGLPMHIGRVHKEYHISAATVVLNRRFNGNEK